MLPVIFSEVNLKNEQGEKPNEQVVETACDWKVSTYRIKRHRKTISHYVIAMHTSVLFFPPWSFSFPLSLLLTLSHHVVDLDLEAVAVSKATEARKLIETH